MESQFKAARRFPRDASTLAKRYAMSPRPSAKSSKRSKCARHSTNSLATQVWLAASLSVRYGSIQEAASWADIRKGIAKARSSGETFTSNNTRERGFGVLLRR